MSSQIGIFPTNCASVESQMAFDEAIFEWAISHHLESAFLRFYTFREQCATIGFGQRNLGALPLHELTWTRRLTGGGFVRHDRDLVLTLVASIQLSSEFGTPRSAYLAIHRVIWTALKHLGVETRFYGGCKEPDYSPEHMLCFERPICDDLILGEQKIAGGAERRSSGYFLHQESIDLQLLLSKGILKEALQEEIVKQFERAFGWLGVGMEISDLLVQAAQELTENKYQNLSWKLKGHGTLKKEAMVHGSSK